MIASLHGKLEAMGGDWAIINVGGVGFRVYMPTSTLSTLGAAGSEVHLRTQMVMREDSASLYGFGTAEELELFQTLTGVSGLGPRLALAMLSSMTVEQAVTAITTGSAALLTTVPGIGKRMAERLIVELKDKLSAGLLSVPAAGPLQDNADVIATLTALGYSLSEASQAVSSLPSSDIGLEDKIKLALQYFTGK